VPEPYVQPITPAQTQQPHQPRSISMPMAPHNGPRVEEFNEQDF
jgi:hypothetical protein